VRAAIRTSSADGKAKGPSEPMDVVLQAERRNAAFRASSMNA
jgi:hypothetical protein